MPRRFPDWMKKRIPSGQKLEDTRRILNELHLATVCQEALCPNQGECFSKGTATFMILGEVCTRNCRFCAVAKGGPLEPDPDEPERVAEAAYRMGLKHVVITSVTRDDLDDGGAGHFAQTIRAIRSRLPEATIEVLTPDFGGDEDALRTVIEARPNVFNHNVETVPSLYSKVRPQANYRRSLAVLEAAKRMDEGIITKSGMMVGLGERADEVEQVMRDLRDAGCDFLTIGQYLSPSESHLPVVEFIAPQVFEDYKRYGYSIGFSLVASGPFVRSSYNAGELLSRLSVKE